MVEKKIYDATDVMTALGVSKPTLTRWIKSNKIPQPFKFGDNNSKNRWLKEDIEKFAIERATNQTTNS